MNILLQSLAMILFLSFTYYLGFKASLLLLKKNSVSPIIRLTISIIVGFALISTPVAMMQKKLGFAITLENVTLTLLITLIFVEIVHLTTGVKNKKDIHQFKKTLKRYLLKIKKPPSVDILYLKMLKLLNSLDNYTKLLSLIGIIATLFIGFFFLFNPYSLKGDMPTYAFRSGKVAYQKTSPFYYDRDIIDIAPGIMTMYTNVHIVISLKIFILFWIFISGLLVAELIKLLTSSNKLAYLAAILTYLNPGMITMSSDFIANFIGITGINFLLLLILKGIKEKDLGKYLLIIAFIWGSLFRLHGLVSFYSLPLFLPVFGFYFIKNFFQSEKRLFFSKKSVIALLIFLFFAHRFLLFGLPEMKKQFLVLSKIILPKQAEQQIIKGPVKNENRNAEANLVAEKIESNEAIGITLQESQLAVDFHGFIILFLAFLGFFILLYQARWNKKNRGVRLSFLIICLEYFAITQQGILGFNWWPSRFVIGAYFLLIPLVLITTHSLIKIYTKDFYVHLFLIITLIVCLYTPIQLSILKLKGLSKTAIDTEFEKFFLSLDRDLPQKSRIYSTAVQTNWPAALSPKTYILSFHSRETCKDHKENSFHYALRSPVENITKYIPESIDYILLDTSSSCIYQNNFTTEHFERVSQVKSLQLLKVKRN